MHPIAWVFGWFGLVVSVITALIHGPPKPTFLSAHGTSMVGAAAALCARDESKVLGIVDIDGPVVSGICKNERAFRIMRAQNGYESHMKDPE